VRLWTRVVSGWRTDRSVSEPPPTIRDGRPRSESHSFGGFHFGPPPDAIERDPDPLLLSWVANNYWDTNFPEVQNGPVKLRYGLLTLAEPDPAEIAAQAAKLRNPVLAWPVTTGGRKPSAGRL